MEDLRYKDQVEIHQAERRGRAGMRLPVDPPATAIAVYSGDVDVKSQREQRDPRRTRNPTSVIPVAFSEPTTSTSITSAVSSMESLRPEENNTRPTAELLRQENEVLRQSIARFERLAARQLYNEHQRRKFQFKAQQQQHALARHHSHPNNMDRTNTMAEPPSVQQHHRRVVPAAASNQNHGSSIFYSSHWQSNEDDVVSTLPLGTMLPRGYWDDKQRSPSSSVCIKTGLLAVTAIAMLLLVLTLGLANRELFFPAGETCHGYPVATTTRISFSRNGNGGNGGTDVNKDGEPFTNLPTCLGTLTALTFLNFYNQGLTGSLPTELGRLSQLTFLSVRSNRLAGTLPTAWGRLSQLESLVLRNNQLEGRIPSGWSRLTGYTSKKIDWKGRSRNGHKISNFWM